MIFYKPKRELLLNWLWYDDDCLYKADCKICFCIVVYNQIAGNRVAPTWLLTTQGEVILSEWWPNFNFI